MFVGAARTTVTEVARLAGVNRMTVYKHFATEAEMVEACRSHWIGLHAPPAVEAWAGIADPAERLSVALGELYAGRGARGARGARGRRRGRLHGALRLAVDFPAWRTLTASGLDDADAATVASAFVEAAAT